MKFRRYCKYLIIFYHISSSQKQRNANTDRDLLIPIRDLHLILPRKKDAALIVTGTLSLEKLSALLPSDFCVVMVAMGPTPQKRIFDNFLAYLTKNKQVSTYNMLCGKNRNNLSFFMRLVLLTCQRTTFCI